MKRNSSSTDYSNYLNFAQNWKNHEANLIKASYSTKPGSICMDVFWKLGKTSEIVVTFHLMYLGSGYTEWSFVVYVVPVTFLWSFLSLKWHGQWNNKKERHFAYNFIKLEKPKHKCTVQISADPKIIRSKMKKMKSNLQWCEQ